MDKNWMFPGFVANYKNFIDENPSKSRKAKSSLHAQRKAADKFENCEEFWPKPRTIHKYAPAQELLRNKISVLENEIRLMKLRNLPAEQGEKLTRQKRNELDELKKQLKDKQAHAKRNMKYRMEKRKAYEALNGDWRKVRPRGNRSLRVMQTETENEIGWINTNLIM